jgi:hypothetical protein
MRRNNQSRSNAMHYEMKDRIKIATALGYYARATDPEAASLSAAIQSHALAEYRNDIDCQIAFRKGFQEAEEHFAAEGQEAHELRELVGWIARLEQQVMEQRQDILKYLKLQELIASTPIWMRAAADAMRAAPERPAWACGRTEAEAAWHSGDGSGGGGAAPLEAVKAKMGAAPADTISISVGGGGGNPGSCPRITAADTISIGGGGGGGAAPRRAGRWYMRKVGGDLYCQMGKPVSFPDRVSCSLACADLETSTGLKYEPSYDPNI